MEKKAYIKKDEMTAEHKKKLFTSLLAKAKRELKKEMGASYVDVKKEQIEERANKLFKEWNVKKDKADVREVNRPIKAEKRIVKATKKAEKEIILAKGKELIRIPVLPEESPEVDLPEYYAVEKKSKKGIQYKLVNPLTKQRNIATRRGAKPITIKRKEVDEVSADKTNVKSIPLSLFVKKDQEKAYTYNDERKRLDAEHRTPVSRPDKSHFEIKSRGRPEVLPKNIAFHKARGTSKMGKVIKKKDEEETKEEREDLQEEKENEPEPKKKKVLKVAKEPENVIAPMVVKKKSGKTCKTSKRRR